MLPREMSDLDRLTQEAATKAAVAVGRDAAKRAVDELLSGEDTNASAEESAADSKNRRWKIIGAVVLGLCLVVGVLGLLLHYWLYFLAAGLLGVGGLVGWSRLRKRMGARQLSKGTAKAASKESAPALEPVRVRLEAPEDDAAKAAIRRAKTEAEAQALEEAHAVREQEVDDELAAMKARLKR